MSLILENKPNARFEETAGTFITGFVRSSFLSDSASTVISTSTKKGTDASTEQEKSTETKVMELIAAESTITLAEIAERLGLTKSGVRYHTDRLQARGMLKRHGRKDGFWETF